MWTNKSPNDIATTQLWSGAMSFELEKSNRNKIDYDKNAIN